MNSQGIDCAHIKALICWDHTQWTNILWYCSAEVIPECCFCQCTVGVNINVSDVRNGISPSSNILRRIRGFMSPPCYLNMLLVQAVDTKFNIRQQRLCILGTLLANIAFCNMRYFL